MNKSPITQHLDKVLDAVEDWIFVKDTAGFYLECNRAFFTVLEKTEKEVLHKRDIDIFDEESASILTIGDRTVIEKRESHTQTVWLSNKRGVKRYYSIKKSPIRDSRHNLTGIAGIARDITENWLKQEPDELSAFFIENLPDAVRWLDDEGNIVYANEETTRMLGRPKDEIIGHNVAEFDAHYKGEKSKALLKKIKEQGQLVFETEVTSRDGVNVPLEIASRYINMEGMGHYLSLARNISKRKEKERELMRLTKIFNESQKIANIGSWEWNTRSNACIWSDEMYEIFGIDRTEPINCLEDLMLFVHEEDRSEVQGLFGHALEYGSREITEFRIVLPDGRIKVIQANFRADIEESDTRQRHSKIIGTAQDVTKFKEQESLLKSIFDSTEIGIAVIDRHGKLVQVNKKYCELYGYVQKELLGSSFLQLIPKRQRDSMHMIFSEYMDDMFDERTSEWDALHRSGYEFKVLATASRFINDKGEKFKITTVTDVTSQKEIILKQQQQEQLLIQQSKMASMGEMIGAIAHQWRQPLSTITMIAGSLVHAFSMGKLDEESLKTSTRNIVNNARYMSEAIDTFKKFYNIDTEKKVFDIISAIESALYILKPQMAVNFVEVVLQRKSDDSTSCYGFENTFKQAITNLLMNARDAIIEKHGAEGEFEGFIIIDVGGDSDHVEIRIQDNGAGIPDSMREKIFQPYKTTKGKSGTGIGLYITKLIVEEKSEGKIQVTNYKNPTEFTLTLPRVKR